MTRNPYPGLRSFEPGDSELFFGREEETDELRRRLRQTRFLAVVGASGSGKSSLVRSGLLPTLHAGLMSGGGDDWRVALMRPGDDPLAALAAALDQPGLLRDDDPNADTRRAILEAGLRDSARGLAEIVRQAALPSGTRLLLVVDQFEELFRYRRDRYEKSYDARRFVRLLIEAARSTAAPVYVVTTMRAEFIGECMSFAGLAEAINAGQYLIPRMSRDAMRRAIGAPAQVRGTAISARLMVRLLNEVGNDLDRLPVLQHALMRTWQAWEADHADGEPLDVRHYDAIGAMREALSRHAEEALADLAQGTSRAGAAGELSAAEALRITERLWKSLTDTTEDGRGVRRPTNFAALQASCGCSAATLTRVIDAFRATGRGFLQPPFEVALNPDTVIDITHESLMRLWPQLVEWTRQEAGSTEIWRSLLKAAQQYAAGEASLWRQPELTRGLRWQRVERPSAAWAALANSAQSARSATAWTESSPEKSANSTSSTQSNGLTSSSTSAGDAEAWQLATDFLRRSRRAHWLRRGVALGAVTIAVGSVIVWLAYDAQRNAELAQSNADLAKAREAELDARQRAVEALTDQVKRLASANIEGEAAKNDEFARVQTLRKHFGAAKAEVDELLAQRQSLDTELNKLRSDNRALEQEIARIEIEQRFLTQREAELQQTADRIDTQTNDLTRRIVDLEDLPVNLKTQIASLMVRDTVLSRERYWLNQVEEETRPCILDLLPTGAGWSPNIRLVAPLVVRRIRMSTQVPPELQQVDNLRERVEALARRFNDLLAERAKLQDEAGYLEKANALLKAQASALKREVSNLSDTRKYLQQRQAFLRPDLAYATRIRAETAVAVANLENKVTVRMAALIKLQEQHAKIEEIVVKQGQKVSSLISSNNSTESEISRVRATLRPIVNSLVQHATDPNEPPDLAAMLAVKAHRWTPDAADDQAHPSVYNGLWLALQRLDAKAAAALLAPGDPAKGKLGTTTAQTLVAAICQRAARPITEAEWKRYLPKDACYTPAAAYPCSP